jgi:hypothetical protein
VNIIIHLILSYSSITNKKIQYINNRKRIPQHTKVVLENHPKGKSPNDSKNGCRLHHRNEASTKTPVNFAWKNENSKKKGAEKKSKTNRYIRPAVRNQRLLELTPGAATDRRLLRPLVCKGIKKRIPKAICKMDLVRRHIKTK